MKAQATLHFRPYGPRTNHVRSGTRIDDGATADWGEADTYRITNKGFVLPGNTKRELNTRRHYRASLARNVKPARVTKAQRFHFFFGAHPLVPIHLSESLELLLVPPVSPWGRTRTQNTR